MSRMVTVHRQSNWRITLYARDHGIPHFHLEGPGFRCSIAIATLGVIVGHAPAPVLKEARSWAPHNRMVLMEKWNELNG
jgi:hypothetical protein